MRRVLEWKRTRSPGTWGDPEILGLRVLVAEDDAEMRSLIATALAADGCDVLEASDGRELFEILAAMSPPGSRLEPPDIIVSDIRMPGPSGLDGLALLRQSTWSVPVIVITGFGDLATHDEARRLGAAIVLDKPFDMEVLRTAVITLAPV